MADERPERVSIGFQGSLPLAVRLTPSKLGELQQAVRGAERGVANWLEVEGTDGTALVDLGQVVYVRLEASEQRVGFGT